MLKDLVRETRSYRRFHEDHTIDTETLTDLVDLARHTASGANLQPLKYFLSCEPASNATIFQHIAWAGYDKIRAHEQEQAMRKAKANKGR